MIKLVNLEKLKAMEGKKITVLKPNSLVPELYKGTLKNFYIGKYAQNENALFINIKLFRKRNVDKIVISIKDTCFIFKDFYNDMFRKEKISNRESLLHRITYNDVKNDKNLLIYHEYNENFEVNENYEHFLDITADYCINNNLIRDEQVNNDGYINFIKDLLIDYNVNKLKNYVNINVGRDTFLHKCIEKAIV